MKAPRNTRRDAEENPVDFLAASMVVGSSKAIESQEAQGQQSLIQSDTLPTEMEQEDKEALEAAGCKFLGPVDGDALFQYVQLPVGWKKVPTEHSMWSHLIDEKGAVRASIFYKAAFYDRKAFLRVEQIDKKGEPT